MGQFSVSTPALGYSAAAMNTAVATFDEHVRQISRAVNAVVGASWSGDAADEFATSWEEWLRNSTLTREALVDIVTRLNGAEGTYVSTEAHVTAASKSSTVSSRSRTERA